MLTNTYKKTLKATKALEIAELAAEGKYRPEPALTFEEGSLEVKFGIHFAENRLQKLPEAVKVTGFLTVPGREKPLAVAMRLERGTARFDEWAENVEILNPGDKVSVGAGELVARPNNFGQLPMLLK